MLGRFMMGPLPTTAVLEEIEGEMAHYDLAIPRDEDVEISVVRSLEGLYVTAEGPGVRGYLVDSDGLEASGSDVEDFFTRFLPPAGKITIHGHHEVPGSVVMLCRTTITQDDEDGCLVQARRTHVSLDNGPGLASILKNPMEFSL